VLKAALRLDFAGGFTDNISYLEGVTGYLSSIAVRPYIEYEAGKADYKQYINGSGLAISTAANCLQFVDENGGLPFLAATPLTALAEKVCAYENEKYSIVVGKGDVYPIVFGGFHRWECRGERMEATEGPIPRAHLDALEKRILLLYSGIPRENEKSLEEFNANYLTGGARYRSAYEALKQCGQDFAEALSRGDLDAAGVTISRNWEAEKAAAPSVTNPYIDSVYAHARASGAVGGKLSGAGGGGYFVFYSHDREQLAKRIVARFPDCRVQPFAFEHATVREINLGL
jgi:galactokinase/mevalonate kinase-like predicted kinase